MAIIARPVMAVNVRPIEAVLTRLADCRQTGPGRYVCRCVGPLHARGDRHPSLSLAEAPDGTVLLRCWAGCPTADVVAALGMDWRDLFPPGTGSGYPGRRRPDPVAQVARVARERETRELQTALLILTQIRRWCWIAGHAQDVEELDRILDELDSRDEYRRRSALDRAGRWLP